jgi:raffinose/stachyose/melibiose transport system substrate-binding protein
MVDFEMGAFKPPVPEGQETCYISDHVDIALGLNAASPNQEAALTFLEWMTTQEFAELYTNALPGFFTLSDHEITVEDPVAAEFLSWRDECESTIRSSYQILSRGEPNLENELWRVNALMLNGELTPQEAADTVQQGLESWYEPHMEGG